MGSLHAQDDRMIRLKEHTVALIRHNGRTLGPALVLFAAAVAVWELVCRTAGVPAVSYTHLTLPTKA